MNRIDISQDELTEIDQYLNQELSEEAMLAFEARMQTEESLIAKVKEIELIQIGISEVALKSQIKDWPLVNPKTENSTNTKTKKIPLWRNVAIAASIIVCISTLYIVFNQKSEKATLYTQYFKPDPGLMTAMSSTSDYAFEKAMVEYKSGNYEKALLGWKPLIDLKVTQDTLNYFLAMSHLGLAQYKEAWTLLEPLTSQKESTFYREANWYAGLILVQEQKWKSAIPYLEIANFKQSPALIDSLKKK